MKRNDLVRTLARRGKMTQAEAQDRIDELVHDILKSLRQGRPVQVPGLGKLVPEASGSAPRQDR